MLEDYSRQFAVRKTRQPAAEGKLHIQSYIVIHGFEGYVEVKVLESGHTGLQL